MKFNLLARIKAIPSFFVEENGSGKKTIIKKRVVITSIVTVFVIVMICLLLGGKKKVNHIQKSNRSFQEEVKQEGKTEIKGQTATIPKGISKASPDEEKRKSNKTTTERRNTQKDIKYFANQIIIREDTADVNNSLPIGTQFIGKLLTAIDTRSEGALIKVILPSGGEYQGRRLIPVNAILFATARYPGDEEKVYLNFEKGIYPDGQEFKITAQGLSTRDFSPGLYGEYHGTFGKRVAATLGLAFISGATEVLQEKEALGQGDGTVVAPKSTMRNAALAGTSKVTDMESQRAAAELSGEKPYVTLEIGEDLIVSLTSTFIKKE